MKTITKHFKLVVLLQLLFIFGTVSSTAQTYAEDATMIGQGLRLELGAYIPSDNLKNAIGTSPILHISAGIPLNENWRLDPVLSFIFAQSNERIPINGDDGPTTGRVSGFNVQLGANINRVYKINKKAVFDAGLGFGTSLFQTDKKRVDAPDKKDDEYYSAQTIYVSAGIGFKIAAFKHSYIGLELDYYFTPYSLFTGTFSSSLGAQSFAVGISYGM